MDAIVIKNATKRFRKTTIAKTHSTFKTELIRLLQGKKRLAPESWIEALQGVDLAIPKGKTVGIIGRNGAGKSTLLKLMTGIYEPTSGTVEVRGRVSALLELGAGFHPDFSGRENILISSIILGMSRSEVRARMGEIIDFSELGEFIDEPVRTYSSGMYTRLAFSVATHVDPDILIIDEILAVGDEHFLRKSRAKMDQFKRAGKTIVLVTHALNTVEEWCDQAAWIDEGRIRMVGNPRAVVCEYVQAILKAEQGEVARAPSANGAGLGPRPDSPVTIERVRLLNGNGTEVDAVDTESLLDVYIHYRAQRHLKDIVFGIRIVKAGGIEVYATDTVVDSVPLPHPLPECGAIQLRMPRLGLMEGLYYLDVVVRTGAGEVLDLHQARYSFRVHSSIRDQGIARPVHQWMVESPPTGR